MSKKLVISHEQNEFYNLITKTQEQIYNILLKYAICNYIFFNIL
jgi:hypothetical protein